MSFLPTSLSLISCGISPRYVKETDRESSRSCRSFALSPNIVATDRVLYVLVRLDNRIRQSRHPDPQHYQHIIRPIGAWVRWWGLFRSVGFAAGLSGFESTDSTYPPRGQPGGASSVLLPIADAWSRCTRSRWHIWCQIWFCLVGAVAAFCLESASTWTRAVTTGFCHG
jgi:hypothetical protein